MDNIIREEYVTTRDGTKLYTEVVIPGEGGKFPVIVERHPYVSTPIDAEYCRKKDYRGYVHIFQHCRGAGMSEGEFLPYQTEETDGLDLLDWIRKQDFYNGEIYLAGSSYGSTVHISYMRHNPPDVKAMLIWVQDCNRYNIVYRNGFYKIGLVGDWCLTQLLRKTVKNRSYIKSETFRTMPLAGISESVFGRRIDCFEEELVHPDKNDPYWQTPAGGSEYRNIMQECNVPILLVTGLYDIYTEGVFDMWDSIPADRKNLHAMIVTPYEHNFNHTGVRDPENFPDFPNGRIRDLYPEIEYDWFDHHRLGTPFRPVDKGRMMYYTLFENQWHTADRLHDSPTEESFYLTADRQLAASAPSEKGEITYVYNPFVPATFQGGVCNNFGGMQFQDPPNSRYDIISFQTEPFTEKRICNGRIRVKLQVKTSAPDTCFYVRLSLVRKDGTALALRDDIDSVLRTNPDYQSGGVAEIDYQFAPHSFMIGEGERLRLDVSSSCFPHFHIHTNRKGIQTMQTGADIAKNTILTGESVLRIYIGELKTN